MLGQSFANDVNVYGYRDHVHDHGRGHARDHDHDYDHGRAPDYFLSRFHMFINVRVHFHILDLDHDRKFYPKMDTIHFSTFEIQAIFLQEKTLPFFGQLPIQSLILPPITH